MSIVKESVEYDGYYFIDVVTRDGFRLTIPARGYNLRSWLNFEQQMGAQVKYRAVSEKVWMKTHWTQTPYEEEKPAKKAVKKAPAKKVAPATKAVKKTTKEKNVRSRKTTTTKSSST